ncbi:hypothetical protein [Bacillus tuaregi]|uniref:hypothetical protein n=1 Tax=Bacillus tuaregi TaxID=1816695 RepID=UPI0008F8A744|nr:hypothetical protein [Bacillus tuaregi]
MKAILKNVMLPFSTFEKAYKILMSLTILIPVVFGIYMMMTMSTQGLNFEEYLNQSVWSNIQLVVSMLGLTWAYILFSIYQNMDTEEGKAYIGFALWIMLISQIAVSNLLITIVVAITLYLMKVKFTQVMKLKIILQNKLISLLMLFLLFFSFICSFVILRVGM